MHGATYVMRPARQVVLHFALYTRTTFRTTLHSDYYCCLRVRHFGISIHRHSSTHPALNDVPYFRRQQAVSPPPNRCCSSAVPWPRRTRPADKNDQIPQSTKSSIPYTRSRKQTSSFARKRLTLATAAMHANGGTAVFHVARGQVRSKPNR